MIPLRVSTADTFMVGPILDSAGAAKTDEVVASLRLSKNGGTPAVPSSVTLTHQYGGYYLFAANTTDTNTVGKLSVSLNSGTNTMAVVHCQVLTAPVYDAIYATGATGALPVSSGGIVAASIAATALNGKGDWNIGKTGYSLTQSFPSNFADLNITPTTGRVNVGKWLDVVITDPLVTDSDVLTQVTAGLTAIHLDHLLAVDYDPAAKPGVGTALLNELIENNAGVSRYTAAALFQAPTGGGGTGSGFTAIPWNSAWDAEVQSEVTDALNAYDPPTKAEMDSAHALLATPTNITAGTISTVTNLTNLPTMPTDWLTSAGLSAGAVSEIQSGLATPTNITAATGVVLSGVTHTGATIPTVTAVTNRVTANTDQINGNAAAALRLALSAGQIIPATVDATTTPTTTVFQCADVTEATATHFKDRAVLFTSGPLVGQLKKITAYSLVGGKGQFTVETLTEAPSNTNTLVII